jgi:hypothetical protein
MNDGMVWTRRGRLVRNTVMTLLFLAVVSALNTWSTPEDCRGVSPREWSDTCKSVMLK